MYAEAVECTRGDESACMACWRVSYVIVLLLNVADILYALVFIQKTFFVTGIVIRRGSYAVVLDMYYYGLQCARRNSKREERWEGRLRENAWSVKYKSTELSCSLGTTKELL